MARRSKADGVDSVEKLARLLVDSMDEQHNDVSAHFDRLSDQLSALQDRVTAVESKIAGLHRRIDQELDTRKQHEVRLARVEKRLELSDVA